VPAHLHARHDEFGCMLEGAGQLWIGEEVLELVPGATWAIPQGTPHRGVFTAAFRIVAWFTPWDDPAQPDRVECVMPSQ
jgi:quercetin dioxygenase-like cupin family protein